MREGPKGGLPGEGRGWCEHSARSVHRHTADGWEM